MKLNLKLKDIALFTRPYNEIQWWNAPKLLSKILKSLSAKSQVYPFTYKEHVLILNLSFTFYLSVIPIVLSGEPISPTTISSPEGPSVNLGLGENVV